MHESDNIIGPLTNLFALSSGVFCLSLAKLYRSCPIHDKGLLFDHKNESLHNKEMAKISNSTKLEYLKS